MPSSTAADRVLTQCPSCKTVFRIPLRYVGQEARCTSCGKPFQAQVHSDSKAAGLAPAGEDGRIGMQVGSYKLLGVLGRGGMGAVYEAMDSRFGRTVALKILPPEMTAQGPEHLQRFLREGRLAGQLQHPNVVNVHEVGRAGDLYFIAMELVRGGSASAFLKAANKPLPPRAAVRVIKEAARGLGAAHAIGIVHRDVKPANIMLGEHGLVKLADFGLAKSSNGGGAEVSVTGVGGVIGTPSYMSPEQIQGRPVDHRSDLYSLGATFYCLLIGRPPFYSENPATVLYRHVHDAPPDPCRERPEIPPRCADIIHRAMAKDPADRYQTADEFIRDLETIDFAGAQAGMSDDAMNAWLNTVAQVKEGETDETQLAKRRRDRWRQTFLDPFRPVLDFLTSRSFITTVVVLLVLALAAWMLVPWVIETLQHRFKGKSA
jgi:predicted Zn finger-like uncharacterized protein